MGFKIVYGRSGSGKSKYIYDEINTKIKENNKNKIYIITPEQFSFTAEKKLMENKKSIINAEVISFNRMAYRVLNETEGIHNNLTKCGKSMLIYSILQKEKNNLKLLNKSDENIDLIMRIISELKKNNITILDLKNVLLKIEDNYLKIKLEDIILIYENFNNKIENNYIDETDLLTKLNQKIEEVDLFKNSIIYLDEFIGFTKQELEIIKKLINISKEITITVCTDNLDFNTNPDTDIFYPNKITINKILKLLNKDEKIELINLNNLYRFKNEELIFIEKYLYNKKIEKYNKKIKNINLFLAKNKYSEIEYVAKNINYLIKTENIKYDEIGIITKNINSYSSLFKAIFSKYEIPIFIDEKKDLSQNILIRYILGILEIIIKNYSYESIFNYLKNPLLNLDEDDIFKLEKYCIKYGIKNNKFKKDFIYGINEKNKEEINYLNNLKNKLINPIINLENKINKKQNIKNLINEFYLFLINENIENKINNLNKKINNNLELIDEIKLSFNIIINIFDEIIEIFNNEKITLDNFYKIFKIELKNSSLGKIPQTHDCVMVGDTDRTRTHKIKIMFIIGLNDGVFPKVNKDEGFLNDNDRNYLKEKNIELAKGTIENLYDEKFNIYKAFTTAEEKIFLSYPSTDIDGKSLRESNIILKIKKIFNNLKEESDIFNKKNYFINEKEIFENLINYINKINDKNKIKNIEKINLFLFYKYFLENNNYNKILNNNLNYIKKLKMPTKIKKENIQKLYGDKINTSVSKLEKFKSCPYEYFLQYSLKLKEKEELKIKNLDTGTFLHEILDLFFEEINYKKINIKNIQENELEEIINKIIDEKLKENKYYIFTATEKYKLLVKRLKRILLKSIKYILYSLNCGDFNLLGTEVSFDNKNGKYKPIKIKLDSGKEIEIIGKIDRIDIAQDKNNKYIRIIDYKSSIKDIDYSNVYAGLQLQLITYLDAICKIEDFIPAGILYFNLLEQTINSDKKLTEEEIEEKIKNNFKMKGLILADVKIAKMQDNNLLPSTSSKIIPATLNKEENFINSKSSIATLDEFKKLQDYAIKTIKEIMNEILNGNISLKPYYNNKKTPCEFCIYKNVCGFNSKIFKTNYRYIKKMKKEEFYNII